MKPISRSKRRRGASVIEASLTLTLFLAVLFTIFDFGYGLFLHQTIVNRARAAARYGALNPGDLAGVRAYVLYNSPMGSGAGMFGLTGSNVTATRIGSGTTADRINVTVANYTFNFVTLSHAGWFSGKPITVSIPVEGD
jgi:Flp pilus assembly protein TadG